MSKKRSLLISFVVNMLFLFIYTCVITPVHESNDDLAISFLAEGAYGVRSSFLVYQNILWGKLLVSLYSLIPNVKWYNVLLILLIFGAFMATSYVFIRVMKRKIGFLVTLVLLILCGYHSYVIFQYSRIASLVTSGGLILLFYAIDYAEEKAEKIFCLIWGTVLALCGSMLRFQMFALTVVLVGGPIGLYKLWMIINKKDWFKHIIAYLLVFGSVGILSVICYIVDRTSYMIDDEWNVYQEFNKARTELWDYGFPDYDTNREIYEDLGISYNDYKYYLSWNMDEEVMSVENLQKLVELKPKNSFDLVGYLSVFPKTFIYNDIFCLFLLLSFVAVLIDWKNVYYVLWEFFIVMAFEAYFYYMGRYGIERIDYGMWIAAVMALVYGMSQRVTKLKSVRMLVVTMGIVVVIFICSIKQSPNIGFEADSSKKIYEEIKSDKEHLYIALSYAPQIYFGYEFWKPCEVGELSNIYNAYGWEFNTKTKKIVLDNYSISNIYKDSIDNDKVFFVTDSTQAEQLQTYFRENYNENVFLVCEKSIENAYIWSVHTY